MASDPRPNILWYCSDQQRWDSIGALGNPHVRTPNLDALVAEGVAFTRAYAQSTICTPSRASFMTGRYPASHHVFRNGNDSFPSCETLVTRHLADAGYDCGLIGKLHLSNPYYEEARPDDGYRAFIWSNQPRNTYPKGHAYADWLRTVKHVDPNKVLSGLPTFVGAGVPGELHQTTWCTEAALGFIDEKRDGPWMLNINPFDPHPPFDPPKEYLDHFDPATLPPPAFRPSDLERQKAFRDIAMQTVDAVDVMGEAPPDSGGDAFSGFLTSKVTRSFDARYMKAAYYAQIELIDEQFGRIIDHLRKTGQLENTIVVFTSDHGEMLGDHGLVYKGCRFFEGLVHVPLIMSWPARMRAGLRSPALAELIDIAPTLLDAAGIPIPTEMQGTTLLPICSGSQSPDYNKAFVVSEYNDCVENLPPTHGFMSFDGRFKCCTYEGHDVWELYDLQADPDEFDNLAWGDRIDATLREQILRNHANAILGTISAGRSRRPKPPAAKAV